MVMIGEIKEAMEDNRQHRIFLFLYKSYVDQISRTSPGRIGTSLEALPSSPSGKQVPVEYSPCQDCLHCPFAYGVLHIDPCYLKEHIESVDDFGGQWETIETTDLAKQLAKGI